MTDGMDIQVNRIHVIPPNNTMFLRNGKLKLEEPSPERGLRRPIDDFFRSLAHEQGERAVGVIFSGTGSDGVQGLREIKFSGGIFHDPGAQHRQIRQHACQRPQCRGGGHLAFQRPS